MLFKNPPTALALGMAVFFSTNAFAKDSGGGLGTLDASMNELVYQTSRTVVTVEASSDSDPRTDRSARYSRVASGIVWDTLGHVLTAASVVRLADTIELTGEQGTAPATVVAIDYLTGLALLKGSRTLGRPVARSNEYTCVGQMVLMIGNSLGLRSSPSLGFCAGARADGNLQFQALLTGSSAGGGLFDLRGELVGIVVGTVSNHSGADVGMAVPSHQLDQIVRTLRTGMDRTAGSIGISAVDIEITPPLVLESPVRFADASSGGRTVIRQSVLVSAVAYGSPAQAAGIVTGDLLIGLDSEAIESALGLLQTIKATTPGLVRTFQIIRGNQIFPINVRVEESRELPYGLPSRDYQERSQDSLVHELEAVKRQLQSIESRLGRGR